MEHGEAYEGKFTWVKLQYTMEHIEAYGQIIRYSGMSWLHPSIDAHCLP